MYHSLHNTAFPWETLDNTQRAENVQASSQVIHSTNRGSEDPITSSKAVFAVKPKPESNTRPFIPPYFVPPCSNNSNHSDEVSQSDSPSKVSSGRAEDCHARTVVRDSVRQPTSSRAQQNRSIEPADRGLRDADPPVSLLSEDSIPRNKRETWSSESRLAFHSMISAPGYVNRYRLNPEKCQRMIHHLQHPEIEPTNPDGTKDYQIKYQAAHWTVQDGHLYRKSDWGRVSQLRRHLDEDDVWYVLTTEHLRYGHVGRDKFRKVLDKRYIGYTLQEIMFVLRECKKCADSNKRGSKAARRPEDGGGRTDDDAGVPADTSRVSIEEERCPNAGTNVHPRKQSSNFMMF